MLVLAGLYDKNEWSPEQIQICEESGNKVKFFHPLEPDADKSYDPAEVEVLLCRRSFLLDDIRRIGIDRFKNLKFIQLMSTGHDDIPAKELKSMGVLVATGRGTTNEPISEWILLRALEGCKQAKVLSRQQDEKKWKLNRDIIELSGKNVCVIGSGAIGLAALTRFHAFNAHTIAVDIIENKAECIDEFYFIDKLDEAIAKSDVVVITLPLLDATYHIISEKRIQTMKDDAIFINTSRGELVDEPALIRALDNGKFRYVGLDVFEKEPLPENNPLWSYDRVCVTPHNAYMSDVKIARMVPLLAENLRHFANGEKLRNQLDL